MHTFLFRNNYFFFLFFCVCVWKGASLIESYLPTKPQAYAYNFFCWDVVVEEIE